MTPPLPASTAGRSGPRWVPFVVPFVASVVFAVVGWVGAGVLLFVVAVALAQIRVVSPTTARKIDRVAGRFGDALAKVVSAVLLGAAFLFLVLSTWLVARLLGWSPLAPLACAGVWTARAGTSETVAHRPFGKEARPGSIRVRLHGLAVGLVLLGAVAAVSTVGARVWSERRVATPEFGAFGPRAVNTPSGPVFEDVWVTWQGTPISKESFPGEPHAARLLVEMETLDVDEPDDRYGWRNRDLAGFGVHVQSGVRRTRAPIGRPSDTVWLFGGSTAYGIGQRDAHTIASALVAEAERHGRAIEVVNRGVSAYVNDQETELFTDLLAAESAPDAALFFDGCNDLALGFERERYGLLNADVPLTLAATESLQDERAEAARAAGWTESHDAERQARLVAAQYGEGVRRGRAIAAEYDVPVAHVWQPILLSMPPDAPLIRTVAANTETPIEFFAEGEENYRRALDLSGVDAVDMIDVLDGASVPTFFDSCHTNEAGARLQAEALWPVVRELLAER